MEIERRGATRRRSTVLTLCAAVPAAVCALVLGACGSDDSGGSTSGGGKLRVMVASDQATAIEGIAKAFERANPGTKVAVQSLPTQDLTTTARAQINAGSPPDVVMALPGYGSPVAVKVLAEAGKLTDLSDQPWARTVPKPFVDVTSVEGKVYAFEPELGTIGLIYDKKVFQKLGLSIPSTFGELIAMCGRIAQTGKTPIALGVADQTGAVFPGFALAASTAYAENPDFQQQRLTGKVTFADSTGWRQALAMFRQMQDAECFTESPASISWDGAQRQFATGKALMHIAVNSILGGLRKMNPDADFAITPMPASNDPNMVRVPAGGVGAFAIPADAKNPELAKKFLGLFAQPKQVEHYANVRGIIPPTGLASLQRVKLPAGYEDFAPYFRGNRTVTYLNQYWPNPDVMTEYKKGLQSMLSGQSTTPEDILKAMDAAWKN